MFNKINGLGTTKGTDKTKKTGTATPTGGTSFAQMLEAAGQADTEGNHDALKAPFVPAYVPIAPEELTPREAGKKMLTTLEDLAADMMTATPGQSAAHLQNLLDNLPPVDTLTPEQKKVWDELATRAATTLEKLKQK